MWAVGSMLGVWYRLTDGHLVNDERSHACPQQAVGTDEDADDAWLGLRLG